MESSCLDDGNATHIMIEVMPPEEEKVSHNEDSVTSLRQMEEGLDNDPLLSSQLMAAEFDLAGCQPLSQSYQVVFQSSAPSFPQKKSYKVYLKQKKSPGQRTNFQVIFKAFGSAGTGEVAELGHKNTVCCKSPAVGLVKEFKLGEKTTGGGHSSAHVAAKDVRKNVGLAKKLPIQEHVQRSNRTAASHSNISESTPLKVSINCLFAMKSRFLRKLLKNIYSCIRMYARAPHNWDTSVLCFDHSQYFQPLTPYRKLMIDFDKFR